MPQSLAMTSTPNLTPLLRPHSIALVGASAKADTNGLALVQMARIDGFGDAVYPVNPGYSEIEGAEVLSGSHKPAGSP